MLRERGYVFARVGGDVPYVPGKSDRLLIPSYSVQGNDGQALERAKKGLAEAKDGQVVVFCFHGVPDIAHDFVSTSAEDFGQIVKLMKEMKCKVIPMRDLAHYVE